MAKTDNGWRTTFLRRGFGLGPFAYGEQVEQRLQRTIPFSRFAKDMDEQLSTLSRPLPKHTLTWLYLVGLQVRTKREVVQFAEGIAHKKEWNARSTRLRKLLTQLHHFSHYDLEVVLRNALENKDTPKLRASAAQLESSIRKLLGICRYWREFATWGTLRPEEKSGIAFIERHLEKRHSHILTTKAQRVGVIRAMLVTMGLDVNADDDAISRKLRPSRQRKQKTAV